MSALRKSMIIAVPTCVVGNEHMQFEDFMKIKTNPRQRNTEENASRVKKQKRLEKLRPPHFVVHVAELPNGDRYLLDGHTRQYMWMNDPTLQRPDILLAVIYYASSIQDVKDWYSYFDNTMAAETKKQQCAGACRELDIVFKSKLLSQFGCISALRFIGNSNDVYELFGSWHEELAVCDDLGVNHELVPQGILSAMLITIRQNEVVARAFWSSYLNKKTESDSVTHSAVGVLIDEISDRRVNRRIGGGQNLKELCQQALWCYKKWIDGVKFKVGKHEIKSITVSDFIKN